MIDGVVVASRRMVAPALLMSILKYEAFATSAAPSLYSLDVHSGTAGARALCDSSGLRFDVPYEE